MNAKSASVMLAVLGPAWVLAGEAPLVVNAYVTTDKSVDCRTVDSILKSLIKEGMRDEEKVLAVFHWLRRAIWHGRGDLELDLAYNFHYQIHIFGTGSCLRQTTPLSVLWERIGFKTRGWAIRGHHCIQVYYDDKWHLFDPHMNFYVYDRGTPRSIASIEQIKADPTLVTDAVKEGRACPGFLLCGDDVKTFAAHEGWQDMGPFPESHKYRPRIVEPFGNITLRRGETFVRTWKPGEYWVRRYWPQDGPHHSCAARDEQDTVNLPVMEPHVWKTPSGSRRYRHGAVGYLKYEPDLTTDHYTDAVVVQDNLALGEIDGAKALVPARSDKPGEVVFAVDCPYAITAGELKLGVAGTGEFKAAVSTDAGKNWQEPELKREENNVTSLFVDQVNGSLSGYHLKLSVPPAGGIRTTQILSHFQLNPISLPYLVPGENVVTIEAQRFGSPLVVTLNWAEGPDWANPRSFTRTFSSTGTVKIDVNGPKYPRMVALILSVAP